MWPESEYRAVVAEVERLRRIIHIPLSSKELKLIDKNCNWIVFKHAWNAIIKSRLEDEERKRDEGGC